MLIHNKPYTPPHFQILSFEINDKTCMPHCICVKIICTEYKKYIAEKLKERKANTEA